METLEDLQARIKELEKVIEDKDDKIDDLEDDISALKSEISDLENKDDNGSLDAFTDAEITSYFLTQICRADNTMVNEMKLEAFIKNIDKIKIEELERD